MIFICANCRKVAGKSLPDCQTCNAVSAMIAAMPEPQPMKVSVAPKLKLEPEPIVRRGPQPWSPDPYYYSHHEKPISSFPVLEHRWHDYPPDYPYFEDFKLSYEARSYMKNQIECEFDSIPELEDLVPELCAIYWRWR